MMKTISVVVGARPNFMKAAPLLRALASEKSYFNVRLVHSGQHYDYMMNKVFFDELGIPEPDINFECNKGSQSQQIGQIMASFERDCIQIRPDYVVVLGDVTSTLACAIAAKKNGVRVAHVEAGLRSFDRSMPEEINRIMTDSISDLFFTTEASAVHNLLTEGVNSEQIHEVGNLMIDNLYYQMAVLKKNKDNQFKVNDLVQDGEKFGVITLHRPSNVDNRERFTKIVEKLNELSYSFKLIFPAHPRTSEKMRQFDLRFCENIKVTDPLSYSKFLSLWKEAAFVVTDSGGLQEETTALGIPCFTLRKNTERPSTIELGTNRLVDEELSGIFSMLSKLRSQNTILPYEAPALWDGKAAIRISKVLKEKLFH